MVFDLDMVKAFYASYETNVSAARKVLGRPLTLSEKILYAHLWEGEAKQAFTRGTSYVDLSLIHI